MTDTRKPFLSIAADVDDEALEAIARGKGVPSLTPPDDRAGISSDRKPDRAGQGAVAESQPDAIADRGPTPRTRMSYVKACLPDYALTVLKTRAIEERVSINHILIRALSSIGIAIRPEDMIEDGRRLRGKNAVNAELP